MDTIHTTNSVEATPATIPATGFVRLREVLKVIPVGKTCWWEGVKSGRYPKPVKLSARCTAWRVEDVHRLIRELGERATDRGVEVHSE